MKRFTLAVGCLLALFVSFGYAKKKDSEPDTIQIPKATIMSDRDHGLVIKKFEQQFPKRIATPLKNLAPTVDEFSDAQLQRKFDDIHNDVFAMLDDVCAHFEFTVVDLDTTHKRAAGRAFSDELDARLNEIFGRIRLKYPYEDLIYSKSELLKEGSQDLTYLAKAQASSTLRPSPYNDYIAANVLDGLSSTCWCEATSGKGIGQWVKLTFPLPAR